MSVKIVSGSTFATTSRNQRETRKHVLSKTNDDLLLVGLPFFGFLAVVLQPLLRQRAVRWGYRDHIEVRDCRPLRLCR